MLGSQIWNVLAPPVGPKTMVSLQWLRFLAAMMVVIHHLNLSLEVFARKFGVVTSVVAMSGEFGVQVFFVISGLIMVHVAGEQFGSLRSAKKFALNRAIRIVPLYWTLTLLQVAVLIISGSLPGEPGRLSGTALIKSMLFIPRIDYMGLHRPLLEQGWTLNFEMAFYAVFAVALILPRLAGLAIVAAVLALMAALSPFVPDQGYGLLFDPIVLYFLAGVLIGVARKALWSRGWRGIQGISAAMVCSALMAASILFLNMFGPGAWQPIIATAVVASAVCLRDVQNGLAARLFAFGGDISYSAYLSHGFVLLFSGVIWRRLFGADYLAAYYCLTLVACILAAALCHLTIERWLTAVARRLFNGSATDVTP
jgi:peptidoglycan/LPS O-acetylase OafA/YrhL